MKLILMLIGSLFIMTGYGFDSESDLAPIEKVTVSNLDYDCFIVISSDKENDLVINTDKDSCSKIYVLDQFAGNNSETNHLGLPSTKIILDKLFIDYPDLNEWKTYKNKLNFKHSKFTRSLGGVNLKISKLSL